MNLIKLAKIDRLCEMRSIFDKPNDSYVKYYGKKHKRFRMKICKLCFSTGYKCNMTVYLGKDRTRGTATCNRDGTASCWKLSDWHFRLSLIRDLMQEGRRVPQPQPAYPTWRTTWQTLALGNKTKLVPSLFCEKIKKQGQNSHVHTASSGCVLVRFMVSHTKFHFWRLPDITL